MADLPTNYSDDVLASSMGGRRRFKISYEGANSVYAYIEDASEYEQVGSTFGAKDINETNGEVNKKLSKSGGGVDGEFVFAESDVESKMIYAKNLEEILEILRMITGTSPTLIVGNGLYEKGTGALNLSAGGIVRLITVDERLVLEASDDNTNGSQFRPYNDNNCALGTASKRFYGLWAGNSTIQTSDAREKENVVPLGVSPAVTLALDETTQQIDIHSELFDRLQPVQYNFIDGNGRICYGLIAQDVIAAMEELGIGENELDLLHHEFHTDEETGEKKETFGIAYNNFIAMLIHEMQKAKSQIATLQAEINALKGL